MSIRKKIILYNPSAVFFDMPLALLAIGSVVDPDRYEVIIIDGRIEKDPRAKVAAHLPDALCFGTTVITGAPIRDALEMSEFVKSKAPNLPVIRGGWHTSLFPSTPLEEHTCIDITVQGQGEDTFRELVAVLEEGGNLDVIKGITFRKDGRVVKNPPRPMASMEGFGRVNYDLVDVERYFNKKGRRQFDYISSTGCYFRCAFCADPFVYERRFTAIPGVRIAEDLAHYHAKYNFTDVNFQDETFFTYPKRIEDFAHALVNRNLHISWAATMRADQGERMTDDLWQLCKASGLRRLLIGVESGSQEMMDWMKKDIKLTQVFHCADKCRDLGIAVIFPFIVGFPGESDRSVEETIQVIRQLRRKSPRFETPIFYFKPYPGSAITQQVVEAGYVLPASTREWGAFDCIGSSGPWVSREKERYFEAFKFYLKWGYGNAGGAFLLPLRKMSRWRCEKGQFAFPIEQRIVETLRPKQRLS
ncbi:MAG: B12-binding domain-containing radical SAM protein [Flavobacteriales bacterium]|nr:B12-binding domain-containing radical SAM protein [Flavobacteriales bacterium]MCB9447151.1 B12-binding domain-containing radical SAM protein [Flavobacteriales bacterium]